MTTAIESTVNERAQWTVANDDLNVAAGARRPRFVVVTGAPSAGKTAVLETMKRSFCRHVRILPSAAAMLFGAGFPPDGNDDVHESAELAIFHVQRALERAAAADRDVAVVVCDRGTLDVLAYWRGAPEDLFLRTHANEGVELERYRSVIQLEAAPPGEEHLDRIIQSIWRRHPRLHTIGAARPVLEKARLALEIVEAELPDTCRICSTLVPHTYERELEAADAVDAAAVD